MRHGIIKKLKVENRQDIVKKALAMSSFAAKGFVEASNVAGEGTWWVARGILSAEGGCQPFSLKTSVRFRLRNAPYLIGALSQCDFGPFFRFFPKKGTIRVQVSSPAVRRQRRE